MENVAINRSASLEDKIKFIKQHIKGDQFISVRPLVDSNAIDLSKANTDALDFLLSQSNALKLDDLTVEQAILHTITSEFNVVSRVNAKIHDTLNREGLQALDGLVQVKCNFTFYVNKNRELDEFVKDIQQGVYDKVTHVSGGYGIAFKEYLNSKQVA
jgi:hypothetical protein